MNRAKRERRAGNVAANVAPPRRGARRALRAWTALFFMLVACLQPVRAADDEVMLNFVNGDIASAARMVSEITGRNFLLDPRVKGSVSIISSRPVQRSQVYSIFLSTLRTHGLAAVEGSAGIKIVPEAEAKHNATPVMERDGALPGDQLVTMIHPMQHESAAQILPILRPLIPPGNSLALLPGSNTLVITDYADNARRILKIIESVDRADRGELLRIGLKHASALDVAQAVAKLVPEAVPLSAASGAQARLVVAPDTRSNSLLVRADNPAQLARVKNVVASIDVPARASGMHVIYLRNADAVKIAETLRAMVAAGDARAPAPLPVPPGTTSPPPGQSAANLSSGPTSFIQADAATNSLIIAAPDHVYNSLRTVVDQLDSRRAQVYLEALIAEVSTDKAAEFGIQFQNLSGASVGATGSRTIGGTRFSTTPGSSISGAAANITSTGAGLTLGIARGRLNIPGVGEILNLTVLARALESEADANILSTPNLLTMDNEEAKIVVGQNVPFITGSFLQAGAVGVPGAPVNPFQTIERRDVGLTLRVRPQISEGGTVKLKVYQEVSSILDATNAAGIIINKRSIESTVLVEDNEIIVLGGLVQDDVSNGVDKVPVLGDLPVLGLLFRYDARRRVKTNLMVFLRPVVVRDDRAIASLTQDRYDYIRNEQGNAAIPSHPFLPSLPAPTMPALKPAAQAAPPSRQPLAAADPFPYSHNDEEP